jgi:ribosomal protein S18 acetylase RimI-like enzyme
MADLQIQPLLPSDQDTVWDLLHIALWDPPPASLRPREVLDSPEVRIYAEDWGRREGDLGICGRLASGPAIVGACWLRLVKGGIGLSYIDDDTPQLGIALFPGHQRRGYGERLMRAALAEAGKHYRQVALSVHPQNPAVRLYRRCGFDQVDLRRNYLIMVRRLSTDRPFVG